SIFCQRSSVPAGDHQFLPPLFVPIKIDRHGGKSNKWVKTLIGIRPKSLRWSMAKSDPKKLFLKFQRFEGVSAAGLCNKLLRAVVSANGQADFPRVLFELVDGE